MFDAVGGGDNLALNVVALLAEVVDGITLGVDVEFLNHRSPCDGVAPEHEGREAVNLFPALFKRCDGGAVLPNLVPLLCESSH